MNKRSIGIILALVSAFAFGLTPVFAAIAIQEGSNGIMTMFLRNFIVIIPLALCAIKFKISFKMKKKEFIQLILLNFIGTTATGCLLYSSYEYMEIGLATCIHFIYPVIIMVACLVIFKEKANKVKVIALVLSIMGIICSVNPSEFNIIGFTMSLVSGFTYAFYVIYLDKTGLKHHNVIIITMYSAIINAVFIGSFAILTNRFTLNLTPVAWGSSIMVAILATIIGIALLQVSLQYIDSPTAAIMCTTEPVTSIIMGIIVFNEKINLQKIASCTLIIIAVILIAMDNKRGYIGKDGEVI